MDCTENQNQDTLLEKVRSCGVAQLTLDLGDFAPLEGSKSSAHTVIYIWQSMGNAGVNTRGGSGIPFYMWDIASYQSKELDTGFPNPRLLLQ